MRRASVGWGCVKPTAATSWWRCPSQAVSPKCCGKRLISAAMPCSHRRVINWPGWSGRCPRCLGSAPNCGARPSMPAVGCRIRSGLRVAMAVMNRCFSPCGAPMDSCWWRRIAVAGGRPSAGARISSRLGNRCRCRRPVKPPCPSGCMACAPWLPVKGPCWRWPAARGNGASGSTPGSNSNGSAFPCRSTSSVA